MELHPIPLATAKDIMILSKLIAPNLLCPTCYCVASSKIIYTDMF